MPALIERPKMTRAMYQALKKHIMAEREKKKQAEQEADAELERQRKEEERKRKKEEEDTLTLEQTKEQIAELNTKLESLKNKKHELFSELKKVLHQDEESRKRKEQQQQQQSEMMIRHQFAQTSALTTSSGHPAMYYQGGQTPSGRPAMFTPATQVKPTIIPGMKRQRSPSPPPASMYQQYGGGDGKYSYSSSKPQHGPFHGSQKSSNYSQSASSHSYNNPSSYPSAAGGSSSKYNPASQSAFTSYSTHYAHQQKQLTEPQHQYHGQSGYQIPRQPGYHSSIQQQQQSSHMETGSKTNPTYPDDKFKIQTSRGLTLPGQIAAIPSTPSKGSIVTGYPIRTQAPHQTTPSQSVYGSQSSGPRHGYPQRFY